MKSILKALYSRVKILGLVLFFLGNANAQENHSIYIPGDLDPKVLDAVKDMAFWLQKMSGRTYKLVEDNENRREGIRLQWLEKTKLQRAIEKQVSNDGQSFYLEIKNQQNALIVATGKSSFINGIYTFLQELGFRWYMPGDAWTIIPRKSDVQLNITKTVTPAFRNRLYAGSGGIGAIPGVDPSNTFKKDYDLWNLRNRFSSDYYNKSHSGQYFYSSKKKELDKHPSFFCIKKPDPFGRIDISQPGAVKLFVEWALEQVKPKDPFPVIGVDPADGSGGPGDCLPANMPEIKTWSDKYFWLANQVARQIPVEDERSIVQLYAYASHADTPGFEIHDRVFPVIIPYAFQRITSPIEFIKRWNRKMEGRPMGIYDYWNITQWSVGVPQFNIYSIPEKLDLWKKNNITTIHLESTNAKGPMGHALWLASQMMWNPSMSFDSLYQDFLNDCFGPAAVDIRRMYDRWSLNYQKAMEVNLSLKDLASASQKTTDPAIRSRIAELKAYVHYLKLYYRYIDDGSIRNYNELIDYMNEVHPLRLMQTFSLQRSYIKKPKGYIKPQLRKSSESPALKMSDVYRSVERNFREDLKEDRFTYKVMDFNFDISKVKAVSNPLKGSISYITAPNKYRFHLPVSKTVKFRAGSTIKTSVTILDENGNMVFEKTVNPSKSGWAEYSTRLSAGTYTLIAGNFGGFTRVEFPADIVFISDTEILYYDNAKYPVLYIYVPRGTTEIVYEDQHGPGVNRKGYWIDPVGNRVTAQKIKKTVYRVAVPAGQSGKTWRLTMGHRSFSVLNIPNKFSLTNFDYREN